MLETRSQTDEGTGSPRRPQPGRRALVAVALLLALVAGVLAVRAASPAGDEQVSNAGALAASPAADETGSGVVSSAGNTPPAVQESPQTSVTTSPPPAAVTPPPAAVTPAPASSGSGATVPTTEKPAPSTQTADAPPAGVAPPPPPPDSPAGTATRAATGPVCLNGVFTTIFGGPGQVYFLTDDTGKQTQVLLEEKVAEAAGGALALDRQRVTIRGDAAGASPSGNPQVRATSIRLAGGCP